MTSSSFADLTAFIRQGGFSSVSFDIDGTLYPMRRMERRWWMKFFQSPRKALRFFRIKKTWEGRRKGDQGVAVSEEDVTFFESFLTGMMDEALVLPEVRSGLGDLPGVKVFFLSDHGAGAKTRKLGISRFGIPVNCLSETGELKPHPKITSLLIEKYGVDPRTHLHVGDRWTDEAQARLLGCDFRYFAP